MTAIREITTNLIAEGTRIQGKVQLEHISRINGLIEGEVHAQEGSTVTLGETGVIEGSIFADTLLVDGFIRGEVHAKTKVIVNPSGRVIGTIETPSLRIEFGAHFEGKCIMDKLEPAT